MNQMTNSPNSLGIQFSKLSSYLFLTVSFLALLLGFFSCEEPVPEPGPQAQLKTLFVDATGITVDNIDKEIVVGATKPLVRLTMTSPILINSVSSSDFTLTTSSGGTSETIDVLVSVSNANSTITITPAEELVPSYKYKITLSDKIKNLASQIVSLGNFSSVDFVVKSAVAKPGKIGTINSGALLQSGLTLSWDRPNFGKSPTGADVTAAKPPYYILVSTDGQQFNPVAAPIAVRYVTDAASKVDSATITGLAPSTPYYFKVASVNSVPDTTISDATTAISTASAATAPAKPTNFGRGTTGGTDTTIPLTWTAPANFGTTPMGTPDSLDNYKILISVNGGAATEVSPTTTPISASAIANNETLISGLNATDNYIFSLITTNKSNLSDTVQTGTIKTDLSTPPAKPTIDAVAPELDANNAGEARVSFSVSPDYTDVDNIGTNSTGGNSLFGQLSYSVSPVGATTPTNTGAIGNPNGNVPVSVLGLMPNTEYEIKVTATNDNTIASRIETTKTFTTPSALSAPSEGKVISKDSSTMTTMFVSWTAPTNLGRTADGTEATLTSYDVSYATKRDGNYVNTNVTHAPTATNASISGLNNSDTYFIRVVATNSASQSSADTSMGLKTDLSAPPATPVITNLAAPSVTNMGTASITFTAGPDYTDTNNVGTTPTGTAATFTSFQYQFIPTNGTTSALTDIARAGENVTIRGLMPNQEYQVKLIAKNSNTSSNMSQVFSGTITTASALSAPSDDKVISKVSSTSNSMVVRWTAPSDFGREANGTEATITSYEVSYATKIDGNYVNTNVTHAPTATNASISGLTNSATYFIRVVATNSAGQSSADTSAGLKTDLSKPPATPTIDTFSTPSATNMATASITFTAGPDYSDSTNHGTDSAGDPATFDEFNYQYTPAAGGTSSPLETVSSSNITINNLTPNTAYVLRLVATNQNTSSNTSEFSKTITTASAVSAPSDDKTISKASSTATSMVVSWTAPTDLGREPDGTEATITSYEVSYATSATGTYFKTNLTHAGPTDTFASITGLNTTATYYIRVVATNSAGQSSADTSAGLKTDLSTPPTTPTIDTFSTPSATNMATASITLTVGPDYSVVANRGTDAAGNTADFIGFHYQYTPAGGRPSMLTPVSDRNITIDGLTPNTEYVVRLVATNRNTSSNSSEFSKTITTASALSAPSAGKVITKTAAPTPTSMTVSWTAPADLGRTADGTEATLSSYTVTYDTISRTGSYTNTATLASDTATSVALNGLSSTASYYFRVEATNSASQSSADTSGPLKTDQSSGPTVLEPLLVEAGFDTALISVAKITDFGKDKDGNNAAIANTDPYKFEISTGNGSGWTTATSTMTEDASNLYFRVTVLTANTEYQARLIVTNNNTQGVKEGISTPLIFMTDKKALDSAITATPALSNTIYKVGETIAPVTLSVTSPQTATFAVTTGALPAGLVLSDAGVLSGTPTDTTSGPVNLTVTATGSGDYKGSLTLSFGVKVIPSTFTVTYSPDSLVKAYNAAELSSVSPAISPAGSVSSYFITSLPAGITIDGSGKIVVDTTPDVGTYNLVVNAVGTGNYSEDTVTVNYRVVVNPIQISIDYGGNQSYTFNQAIASVGPNLTPPAAGSSVAYAITPDLNANTGLTFTPKTGVISGTPTKAAPQQPYTITATGTGNYAGTATDVINIEVVTAPFTIDYGPDTTYTFDEAITDVTPMIAPTGVTVSSYAIMPDLNANTGLAFNTNTGVISGTPTKAAPRQAYTITATVDSGNYAGTAEYIVNIIVNRKPITALNYPTIPTDSFVYGMQYDVPVASITPAVATANYDILSVRYNGSNMLGTGGITMPGSGGTVRLPANLSSGNYEVTARAIGTGNYGSNTRTTLTFRINADSLESLAYADTTTFTYGRIVATSDSIKPAVSPTNATVDYSLANDGGITPAPVINASNGSIFIPETVAPGTYTLRVSAIAKGNFQGTINDTFVVVVTKAKLQSISYNPATVDTVGGYPLTVPAATLTSGLSATAQNPSIVYAIDELLIMGLTFDSTDGSFSGTPTVGDTVDYTVSLIVTEDAFYEADTLTTPLTVQIADLSEAPATPVIAGRSVVNATDAALADIRFSMSADYGISASRGKTIQGNDPTVNNMIVSYRYKVQSASDFFPAKNIDPVSSADTIILSSLSPNTVYEIEVTVNNGAPNPTIVRDTIRTISTGIPIPPSIVIDAVQQNLANPKFAVEVVYTSSLGFEGNGNPKDTATADPFTIEYQYSGDGGTTFGPATAYTNASVLTNTANYVPSGQKTVVLDDLKSGMYKFRFAIENADGDTAMSAWSDNIATQVIIAKIAATYNVGGNSYSAFVQHRFSDENNAPLDDNAFVVSAVSGGTGGTVGSVLRPQNLQPGANKSGSYEADIDFPVKSPSTITDIKTYTFNARTNVKNLKIITITRTFSDGFTIVTNVNQTYQNANNTITFNDVDQSEAPATPLLYLTENGTNSLSFTIAPNYTQEVYKGKTALGSVPGTVLLQYQFKRSSASVYSSLVTVPVGDTSVQKVSLSGLVAGETYDIRVVADNGNANNDQSEAVIVVDLNEAVPVAPEATITSLVRNAANSRFAIDLNYNLISNGTDAGRNPSSVPSVPLDIEYQYSEDGGTSFGPTQLYTRTAMLTIDHSSLGAKTITIDSLRPGTYKFRLVVKNNNETNNQFTTVFSDTVGTDAVITRIDYTMRMISSYGAFTTHRFFAGTGGTGNQLQVDHVSLTARGGGVNADVGTPLISRPIRLGSGASGTVEYTFEFPYLPTTVTDVKSYQFDLSRLAGVYSIDSRTRHFSDGTSITDNTRRTYGNNGATRGIEDYP